MAVVLRSHLSEEVDYGKSPSLQRSYAWLYFRGAR
jgi:hypothetical protein